METRNIGDEDSSLTENLHRDFNTKSWIKLVESLIIEHNYQKAEDCIRMALSMSPHSEQLWLALGDLSAKLNRIDEAEKSYLEASKIEPHDVSARKKLQALLDQRLN